MASTSMGNNLNGKSGSTSIGASTTSGFDKATKIAKGVLHAGVGAVVLAFQQLEAQRREFEKTVQERLGTSREQVDSVTSSVRTSAEDQVRMLDQRLTALEARIDAVLDNLQGRLPEQARDVMQQARDAAKAARQQVREVLVPAA